MELVVITHHTTVSDEGVKLGNHRYIETDFNSFPLQMLLKLYMHFCHISFVIFKCYMQNKLALEKYCVKAHSKSLAVCL